MSEKMPRTRHQHRYRSLSRRLLWQDRPAYNVRKAVKIPIAILVVLSYIQDNKAIENSKPVEKQGRKVMGLKLWKTTRIARPPKFT